MRRSYLLWQSNILIFTLNLVATIALMSSGSSKYSSPGGIILAVVYWLFVPLLSFFTWHRLLYNAVKLNTTWRYICWFITFAIQLAFLLFLAIGFWDGGGG